MGSISTLLGSSGGGVKSIQTGTFVPSGGSTANIVNTFTISIATINASKSLLIFPAANKFNGWAGGSIYQYVNSGVTVALSNTAITFSCTASGTAISNFWSNVLGEILGYADSYGYFMYQ